MAIALSPALVTVAHAQPKRPTPDAVHAAEKHMIKARSLYEAGNYPEAIAELETARALDPYAKELVFNLGIVHEKAGHIEDALHFYRLYLEMDLEAAERSRAETIVKRLEGARVHVQPTATVTATVAPPATTIIVTTPVAPAHGRFDGLTVISGMLALGGFGVGAGFGIAALGAKPAAGTVTGGTGETNNGTYADLQSKQDAAYRLAIISDIGFLTGLVFTGVTLGVYFGRTKKVTIAAPAAAHITVSPQLGGLVLRGTF